MKKIRFYHTLKAKIVIIIAMVIIFALQLMGANFITQTERQLVNNFQENQKLQMNFLENSFAPFLEMHENPKDTSEDIDPEEEINALISDFSGTGITSLIVVDSSFVVIGNSDTTQQVEVGQLLNDEDVRTTILQGSASSKQIINSQLNARRWRMVEPVYSSEDSQAVIGAIVMESNIESIYEQITDITLIFLRASLIAILLSSILANMVSKAITDPIKEMQTKAKAIAEGDYSGEVTIYGNDEIGLLAQNINELSEEVETGQRRIEAERQRLDSVLSNMSEGVIATNRRGELDVANNMASQMLNLSRDELAGQNILSLLEIEEDYSLRDLVDRKEDITLNIEAEEEDALLRASFSVIQADSGYISGIVCVLRDVTEEEKVEEERKEFVSNVSHELRTPLTSMRSYIEALIDGAWKDPELAPRFLDVAQSETDRMIRMIQDLLHLSRIDAGKSELQKELIDLTALFTQVLTRFDMLLDSEEYRFKNYKIERNIINEAIFVDVDSDKIVQVLDNVMNNAIKYSPEGGKITCTMTLENNQVLITVKDEGIGIPAEDLAHIFDRFYRVDRARSRAMGGTGLGLAISREVIEQHDGEIWAESINRDGTTFYIALPYIPYEEEEWGWD
ncbi:PAS/PAC sensor signal transduction histidine kinase [Atopostipes suicloacalis DSM 15692]|uniref:histidine kinase n=1 Tax=Atopostipes suicloacalis DSM 15692 TaxID=1121025 RepID=A0A1M4X7S9_9LACT|nr:cell wall metabolism sensor histidine kinase WalK [Atopostipes suicloacalis]SHE89560.1 PAS/PAC sensor signal transduction histidine kinase [Atopostipes suicloacalis DSM 15692]